MSINIGDNFKYLGKKFLDDRESFATLEEMRRCSTVPDGFITYCKEDGKRYEFNSSNNINDITGQWTEFFVNGKGDDDTTHYFGREVPENQNAIWFDEGNMEESFDEIKYNNPIVEELFACINSLQLQIIDLKKEVEYLKVSGGGGNGGGSQEPEDPDPDNPNPPEPDNPNPPEEPERYSSLMMEDGSMFLLEDGGYITLEDQDSPPASNSSPALTLEDEGKILLEDGGIILLEQDSNN